MRHHRGRIFKKAAELTVLRARREVGLKIRVGVSLPHKIDTEARGAGDAPLRKMDKKRESSRKSLRESLREKGAHGGRGVVNRERETRGRERSTSAASGQAKL